MSENQRQQALWDESFRRQVEQQAFNMAPAESLIRTVAHHLRARMTPAEHGRLDFLEVGCGAGPNLMWLAGQGIRVHGVDISPKALELAEAALSARVPQDRVGELKHGSATELPFADESMDGVVESCVFQHLQRPERIRAFSEVARVLKPGGLFVGNEISVGHSTFQQYRDQQVPDDPGSLHLNATGKGEKVHLESIGFAHFFDKSEYASLLPGFSLIDPCEVTYELPLDESARRGIERYRQAMWVVYAIK